MASFLQIFATIGHAAEVAASIAAPIVATLEPGIGALMGAAVQTAVTVEAAVKTPGAGAQKATAVQASTQATIDAINQILIAQGKAPLPANTGQLIATQVGAVIGNLNAIQAAVTAPPAA